MVVYSENNAKHNSTLSGQNVAALMLNWCIQKSLCLETLSKCRVRTYLHMQIGTNCRSVGSWVPMGGEGALEGTAIKLRFLYRLEIYFPTQ
jgi:hypothetical protein